MSADPLRVLVLGAGPAGLAAAIRLKERGGDRVQVRLLTQGHLLGGKAATHRDDEGFTWEHGFHVFFGWYRTLWGLLRRAGVDARAAFSPNRGWTHFADDRGGIDSFRLATNPILTWARFTADVPGALGFALRWVLARAQEPRFEDLDDVCFDAWAAEMGLPTEVTRSARFRFTTEAYFNDPHPISAFVVMRSIQLLSRDRRAAEYYYQRVGLSEGVWGPLAAYFGRLGGQIEPYNKVTGLEIAGDRVGAVRVARPAPAVHACGRPWPERIPVDAAGERWVEDFDAAVCALPRLCLMELNPGDDALWGRSALAGVGRLRGIAPLSVQAFFDRPFPSPRRGAVNGLGAPLPLAVDYQQLGGRWASDPSIESTMSFVGQVAGFEEMDDEALLAAALERGERAGFEGMASAEPTRWGVRRNGSHHNRFALTEPGALRYRPPSDVGLENLFLAGDWVRNRVDIPCMEAAAVSGFEAADRVLRGRA